MNSPKTTQKRKKKNIREKAIISAAHKTANKELTRAKIAAWKQSKVFEHSQVPINISELRKKPTTRIFQSRSPGNSNPYIIADSSSAADFMTTTLAGSPVPVIAKSSLLRNIRKSNGEATIKKLRFEKTLSQLPTSPTNNETTVIDLTETSDETPASFQLLEDNNWSSFGQSIVILSSDSQESNPSFHTASIHSFPTRENI